MIVKKKGRPSSSIERKKINKGTASMNNKKDQKPKSLLTKSVEKKKIIGIPTEHTAYAAFESKLDKEKKGNKHRRDTNSMNSRSIKTNKGKEYDNKLSDDNDSLKDKEFDFFNFKLSNDDYKKNQKNKVKSNNEDLLSKTTNINPKRVSSFKEGENSKKHKKKKKKKKLKMMNQVKKMKKKVKIKNQCNEL